MNAPVAAPVPTPKALSPTQVVQALVQLQGWVLDGEGAQVAIAKVFRFEGYLQALSFVNALAWVAEQQSHHPSVTLEYGRVTVRWNTHSVQGLSGKDFACARLTDALVQPSAA
jgi:4a-hydroxytetrahydrobiopterin dehydratase